MENGIEIVTANANEEDISKEEEDQEQREDNPGYMTTIKEETLVHHDPL